MPETEQAIVLLTNRQNFGVDQDTNYPDIGPLQRAITAAIVGMARNGAAAIRMTTESSPDLVLMDIVMPGLDGLSALRTIKAMHPEIQVPMVSSVSGNAAKAEEAFKLGACQVRGKPFDAELIESLLDSVREKLGRAREEAREWA